MDLSTVTVADFKAYFRRDFPYPPLPGAQTCETPLIYVLDADIEKAFGEAQIVFNQSLFSSDAQIRIAYLYLTAHYLSIDMRAAMDGIEGGGSFPVNSRSVGSVSESYTVPQAYTDNPVLAGYTTTSYGMKYLSLVLPSLVGNIGAVSGWTNP